MNKFFAHFKTITHHRHLVMRACFSVGLYKQGFLHDLSKYSPTEFFVGVKYDQGKYKMWYIGSNHEGWTMSDGKLKPLYIMKGGANYDES